MKKYFLIPILIILSLSTLYGRWGWNAHRFINDAAVDHLPESMFFFQDHRSYLSDHAIDPDTDDFPGNYHYIDIDYYPEFFAGTLPHDWQEMIDLYGQNTMEDNGLVPWVIQWWIDDMTVLMQNGSWNDVWQLAAELGHYVADSHQALHLTLNYNGQMTNNYGIHSRYETQMINPHLGEISFPDSVCNYWVSPLDSIFSYIDAIYPIVDLVMAADDRAYLLDPNHNNTYYTSLWEDLGDTTIWSLKRATMDVASVWYTAWINAGSPYPPGVVEIDEIQFPRQTVVNAFPNPYNGEISFTVKMNKNTQASMEIFDLNGRSLDLLAEGNFSGGEYHFNWDGRDESGSELNSGVYLFVLNTADQRRVKKVTLLK